MPDAAVFIADNAVHLLRSYQEHLETHGYLVYTAQSPEEARQKLESTLQIDVAVIDIRLRDDGDEKDLSGLEVARLRPDVPKIILTAYPDYQTTRIALNRHLPLAYEYLAKQESLERLLDTIRQIVGDAAFSQVEQDHISRTTLVHTMQESFNQDDFRSLVFHLQEELRMRQVSDDLEDILEQHRSVINKMEEVIRFLEKRGQLVLLLHLCRKLRPRIDWHTAVISL